MGRTYGIVDMDYSEHGETNLDETGLPDHLKSMWTIKETRTTIRT